MSERNWLLSAPDEGGGAAAPAAPAPSVPPPSAEPPPSAASTPPPASAATPPSGAAPAAPAAPQVPSWFATAQKFNLPVGATEEETLRNYSQIAQERQALESLRPLVPYANLYQTHAAKFQQWLREQEQATAPKGPEQPWYADAWKPPEFNPNWLSYVQVDPATGKKSWSADTPPEVIAKFAAHQQWQTEKSQEFLRNPFEFMKPMQERFEQRAREIAESIVAEKLQGYQTQNSNVGFIEQNAGWLYEHETVMGDDGKPVAQNRRMQPQVNPATGQTYMAPVLTQWGQRFGEHAKAVLAKQQQRGYQDEQEAREIAFTATQAEFAAWRVQQLEQQLKGGANGTPPLTPQQQANQAFLNKNNPANPAVAPNTPPPAEPPVTGKNLKRRMLEALKAGGAA